MRLDMRCSFFIETALEISSTFITDHRTSISLWNGAPVYRTISRGSAWHFQNAQAALHISYRHIAPMEPLLVRKTMQ